MNPGVSETTQTVVRPVAKSKTPFQMAMKRFRHNKAAVVSIFVLLVIILACIGAPIFTHYSPTVQDLMNTDLPPGPGHLLGTDGYGIDYFTRDLYGGRIDLMFAFVGMVLIMGLGILFGGIAGYSGGWLDATIMRFTDFMLNFPYLLFVIFIQAVFQINSVWLLIVTIGLTGWPSICRLVRGMFLALREQEFVLASQISGARPMRIIFRHLLPNTVGTLAVAATFQAAGLIATEAALAVIGFGVKPPNASWGTVLQAAQNFFALTTKPWAWIPPAVLIVVTILCINFIGDGLRDAFDPSFEK